MEFTYTNPLTEEVPKEIRLEVYKKAKELIENWEEEINFGLQTPQLCLLLPCILYNLENYLDDSGNGETWSTCDTVLAFTEFTEEDIEAIANSIDKNVKRLELVTQWIEKLS